MSYAPVGSAIAVGGAGGATTGAFDSSTADLIVLSESAYAPSGSGTISDSLGNTWTPLTVQSDGTEALNRLYYCVNPTVGVSHTFTTTAQFVTLCAHAFSGAAASPLDQESGTTGTGTSLQPGSLTPSQSGCLVFTGHTATSGSSAPVIPSGFTGLTEPYTGGTNEGGGGAYEIQTTATAVNPNWSWTGSAHSAATMAIFLPAAGGGGVTPSFASTLGAVTLASSAVFSDTAAFSSTLGGASLAGSAVLSGPGAFAATLGGVNLAASAVFVPTGGCSFTTTLGGAALSSSGLFATSTAFASPLGGAGLSLSAAFSVPSAFTSTLGGATLSASAVFSDHSSFSTSLEGATLSAIGSTSTDPAFVFRSTLQSAALSSSVLVPYVAPPVIRIPPLGAIMYQDDIILILDHDDTNDQGGSNPNSTNTYLLKASVQPDRPSRRETISFSGHWC